MGTHRRRTLHKMAQERSGTKEMRIEILDPNTQWTRVWQNLQAVWTPEAIRVEWYKVIYDIVPTNVRLARLNLSDIDRCRLCGRPDTLIHRLTECKEMFDVWEWTRRRIGTMLRTSPKHIPSDWTIRPSFDLGPPQRRRTILWVLAHMVYYSQHNRTQLSLVDYADFLRRARWKTYQRARRQERVGKYLMLL